jgi:hypothetical protein
MPGVILIIFPLKNLSLPPSLPNVKTLGKGLWLGKPLPLQHLFRTLPPPLLDIQMSITTFCIIAGDLILPALDKTFIK